MNDLRKPDLGFGVYTSSEAAAILGRGEAPVTPRQINYWIHTGLTPPSLHALGRPVLSFEDLISLEVVRRFRSRGVSLQKVRWLEEWLRSVYAGRERPLAYDVFFTDGATIWVRETGDHDPRMIEVAGKRPDHYVWPDSITTFAEEIRFEGESGRALSWMPSQWVSIDPNVQFGSPVVAGTRVPVKTVAANLTVASPKKVADWYGLTVEQVIGARNYLTAA